MIVDPDGNTIFVDQARLENEGSGMSLDFLRSYINRIIIFPSNKVEMPPFCR